MNMIRKKLQRIFVENFHLLVEGEALLGLIRVGGAEEQKSTQRLEMDVVVDVTEGTL